MSHRRAVILVLSALMLIAAGAFAQFGGPRGPFHEYPNIPYDGQFTFVRLKYTHGPGGNWYGGWPAWGHGYPLAEQNLMRIRVDALSGSRSVRSERDHREKRSNGERTEAERFSV